MKLDTLRKVEGHEYATHIFLHWDGFTEESRLSAGKIFTLSPLAQVLVVVHGGKISDPPALMQRLGFGRLEFAEVLSKGIRVSLPSSN